MNSEEAKKLLQKTVEVNNAVIKEARKNGDTNLVELTDDLDCQNTAIEKVLQELDNSISKDKVREIRDKLKLEYEKNIEKNPTYAFVLKCKLEVLEELLEDK